MKNDNLGLKYTYHRVHQNEDGTQAPYTRTDRVKLTNPHQLAGARCQQLQLVGRLFASKINITRLQRWLETNARIILYGDKRRSEPIGEYSIGQDQREPDVIEVNADLTCADDFGRLSRMLEEYLPEKRNANSRYIQG